jgi:hypothetical protein
MAAAGGAVQGRRVVFWCVLVFIVGETAVLAGGGARVMPALFGATLTVMLSYRGLLDSLDISTLAVWLAVTLPLLVLAYWARPWRQPVGRVRRGRRVEPHL